MASQVILDSIALDIDPEEYIPLSGKRRGSVHRCLDGSTVIQDRGFDASDLVIQLSGKLTSLTTLQSLYALYRLTAKTFTFKDFKGNEFTVVFTPGVESFVVAPMRGSNIGYEYKMMLTVIGVPKWFGSAGTFPSSTE